MDGYPDIFKRSKKGNYVCVCDSIFENIEDATDHFEYGEVEGYCNNGLRRNHIHEDYYKDEFECICGEKGDWYTISENHYRLNKGTCITASVREKNSYCKDCNLQCISVYDYKKHCDTRKHIKNENGRPILPLECIFCNVTSPSQIHAERHIKTQKHKDRVALGVSPETPIPLSCSVCNIQCQSQATIKAHLETNKHKTKMDSI